MVGGGGSGCTQCEEERGEGGVAAHVHHGQHHRCGMRKYPHDVVRVLEDGRDRQPVERIVQHQQPDGRRIALQHAVLQDATAVAADQSEEVEGNAPKVEEHVLQVNGVGLQWQKAKHLEVGQRCGSSESGSARARQAAAAAAAAAAACSNAAAAAASSQHSLREILSAPLRHAS